MAWLRRFGRVRAGAWLCLALSLCLLAAPLAGEAVAELVPDDCASVSADAGVHQPGHSGAGHKHHAHSCGGCHVHFMGVRLSTPPAASAPAGRVRPPLYAAPPQAAPPGLFRPPRV